MASCRLVPKPGWPPAPRSDPLNLLFRDADQKKWRVEERLEIWKSVQFNDVYVRMERKLKHTISFCKTWNLTITPQWHQKRVSRAALRNCGRFSHGCLMIADAHHTTPHSMTRDYRRPLGSITMSLKKVEKSRKLTWLIRCKQSKIQTLDSHFSTYAGKGVNIHSFHTCIWRPGLAAKKVLMHAGPTNGSHGNSSGFWISKDRKLAWHRKSEVCVYFASCSGSEEIVVRYSSRRTSCKCVSWNSVNLLGNQAREKAVVAK